MSAADALVDKLPRITLVVGKGGVGKTTCAAALALHASRRHGRTLVLSTDPARALPTVLGQSIGSDPTPIRGSKSLIAQSLDAGAERAEFMQRWGAVIRTILDRGTYLDDADIGPLVDTALPGSDEIFSALALARLLNGGRNGGGKGDRSYSRSYDRIFVDTAPTGHTLRLLNLPRTFRALVRLLEAMQAKHRFMVRMLTRAYRADDADAFLAEMTRLVTTLDESLRDPSVCAAVMVSNPEPLVVDETRRYFDALADLHVRVAAVVWNATDRAGTKPPGDADQFVVPRLENWPVGTKGLEMWLGALTPLTSKQRARGAKPPSAKRGTRGAGGVQLTKLVRPLTIVAGKGGVGKTTVAAAIALSAAETKRTLIVSTDPAPSLGDAFAQTIPDADTPVRGVEMLFARQMDASAAFARLRDEYQARADALFDALIARGVDLTHDRAIARDLFALAPPGIDEVYALSLLSDALFKHAYECVVVDPAPTGHLLRLLEMPQLALSWTHQLMRLMLKYKDVTGLGDTAQELLDFSRNLRALDTLLRDASRCGIVLVALDEPVVRAETERLAKEVAGRGVAILGEILNRSSALGGRALPVTNASVHFQAPAVDPPPIGVAAIRRWSRVYTTHES